MNKIKNGYFKIAAIITCALISLTSTVGVSFADDLWGAQGTDNLWENIAALYRKWAIPLLGITLILYAITKDDKKKEMEKRAAIAIGAVYILTYMIGLITGTLDSVGGMLSSSGN